MNYLGSKQLETERLILHKTEEKDLKELWNILSNKNLAKYYLTTKINDDWEQEKIWQYKKLENSSNQDTFIWTIETKNDNEVIGQISINKTDKEEVKDIGWFIDIPYQNKGYCMEAAEVVLKYMFLEVGIEMIDTCAAIENASSWNLMENLGFKRQNKIKKIKYTHIDKLTECYTYILTKEAFLKELFRKETLRIEIDIDKDPYIKHISDDQVLNVTGESGSGKTKSVEVYKENDNCIVIDTDQIFGNQKRSKDNEELYQMFINKYEKLPDLCNEFDKIYIDIINYFKNSKKLIIIDSAQFRNIRDLSILKGDVIVIRTCINTCYERTIKRYKENNPNATYEEIAEYSTKKKKIYEWYKYLNKFIYKLDRR